MDIKINKNTRIFIIEGIAGSGKDTLHRELKKNLADKLVYDFDEKELLFSWKHVWINNIDTMRLEFYENFLDYCENILLQEPDSVFILNRFHISFFVLSQQELSEESLVRYKAIIERLKKLDAFVFVPMLEESLIENRSSHVERTDPLWTRHLQKRLKQKNCTTLTEMYSKEQKNIIEILEEQGLPFGTVNIDIK